MVKWLWGHYRGGASKAACFILQYVVKNRHAVLRHELSYLRLIFGPNIFMLLDPVKQNTAVPAFSNSWTCPFSTEVHLICRFISNYFAVVPNTLIARLLNLNSRYSLRPFWTCTINSTTVSVSQFINLTLSSTATLVPTHDCFSSYNKLALSSLS